MMKFRISVMIISTALFFAGCSVQPEAINYGKDQCAACRMTIMEPKFAGEIINNNGKVFKFDDAHCVAEYLQAGQIKKEDVKMVVFTNFKQPDEFLQTTNAWFVKSASLKSPMNGNVAAYADKATAEAEAQSLPGEAGSWEEIMKKL